MPLRFTLRQLEYFVAVGEAGSISLASEKVNVSAPSMSSAIAQLEAGFGVQLFTRRHAQGSVLTEPGQAFMEQALKILAEADKLNDLAHIVSDTVRGSLRVGCLRTFAQILIPQLRRQFEDKYADVDFTQLELDQAEIFEGLRSARIDIALTYDLALVSDIAFEPLVKLPPYVMLPPEHPLASRSTLELADLVDHPMVLLDLPHSSDYFLSLFRSLGRRPQVIERTREMAVQRSLVANGFGFGLANIRTVSDTAPDGKPLIFLPLSGNPEPLNLGIATTRAVHVSRRVQAFIDHCHDLVDARRLPGLVV
ncbi:LysR family transcriptional regulator [Vannielia litorea]|uniref:LysR family transcriptional regulator n=1 Tax=Vannielia TaxID=2813041 RepID=UPI001C9772CE|nr:LysR family transcriptional regulator [Vannielia litorea]MBY6048554.1 LysR family transcriptional regulator [Vannielia litorea]MBY6075968.1 LysR family transcriptional regulator [Vannielia litorea]MBY6154184.1 LysR family transcriptional regulator [Vannielia litorea]